jgi:signal transduction histidine kinase
MNPDLASPSMDNFENRRDRSAPSDVSESYAEEAARHSLQAEQALQMISRVGRLLSMRRGSLRVRLQKAVRLTTSCGLASFCLMDLVHTDGRLHRVAAVHRDADTEARLRALPGHYRPDTACSPILEVLHTGISQCFVDYPVEIRRQVASLPEHLSRLEEFHPSSLLVVPLASAGRVLGLLLLARSAPLPPFAPADVELAEELARRLVTAIDSARLRRKAKGAERRAQFLARASQALAGSLDYRVTLDRVARLAVPRVADLCAVDILGEDGGIRRLAVAHREPEKAAVVWELEHRWPLSLKDEYGPGRVIRSGRPELRGEVPEAKLPLAARDQEHLRALRTLGLESYLVAPLQARGRTLGAITFAYTGSHRRYRKADLRLAMELADRAALAVDNALLYRASQAAVRLRDEFLAVASHELKTPLTPLNLRLQSLRRELDRGGPTLDPARVREHVAALQRQSKRLSTLVESLLDVSRLEAGRLELNLEYVDLAALAREVAGRFAAQASRTSTPLEVQAGEPVVGIWDRVRLEQVVSSLLSNALKYGAGRPIHVLVERGPTGARLTVRDQGIGISPEHLPRIFDRFERAVSAEHFGGLGLGLYLTRHLVQAFGGTIRASSQPGRGATFEVDLPLASPTA